MDSNTLFAIGIACRIAVRVVVLRHKIHECNWSKSCYMMFIKMSCCPAGQYCHSNIGFGLSSLLKICYWKFFPQSWRILP